MALLSMTNSLLPAIEAELQRIIAGLDEQHTRPFHEMLTYHMGWTGEGSGPDAQGKRLRPLLVLLTSAACGGDWKTVLPAAAAVELVHNFSLVHDDIQDISEKRRGRDTVWMKWGMPLAINAGDALFVLSNQAILDLSPAFPAKTVVKAAAILQSTCLDLTRGQFLDMSYEKRADLTFEEYWQMVSGKTASLISACTHLGALLAGVNKVKLEAYRSFGHYLGLAFQVRDDFLGIWGNSTLTGKSNNLDLVTGKKTLPVIFGLQKEGFFARRWADGSIRPDEHIQLSGQLAEEGAKMFTQETADQMTDQALKQLRAADPQGEAGESLFELVHMLINRQS